MQIKFKWVNSHMVPPIIDKEFDDLTDQGRAKHLTQLIKYASRELLKIRRGIK